MSEALWMTCHRDPKWAAKEIERLRTECKRLDEGLNRACDRITDLQRQRPAAVMGITMKFETHCPDGQMCGATTTGCMEGECQRDPRLSQPQCHVCGGWVKLVEGGVCLPCHVDDADIATLRAERDACLADLRKCEQQLIAVTPVTHTLHDARIALLRQAIFTVLDERKWDFENDEQRVDFADLVASFIPSETALTSIPTDAVPKGDQFRRELALLLNRYSMESGSNTPDYLLADYLIQALRALDATIKDREGWYGR